MPTESRLHTVLIAAIRKELGKRDWTYETLSRKSTLAESTISRMLNGKSQGMLESWALLLDTLNLEVSVYPKARYKDFE